MISELISGLVMLGLLLRLAPVVLNLSKAPALLMSLPVAAVICRLTLWGSPEATHVLLLALVFVFLHGCSGVVAGLRKLGDVCEWRSAVFGANEHLAASMFFPQRAAPRTGSPQTKTRR